MHTGNKDTFINIVCGESQEPKKKLREMCYPIKPTGWTHSFMALMYVIFSSYTCI